MQTTGDAQEQKSLDFAREHAQFCNKILKWNQD